MRGRALAVEPAVHHVMPDQRVGAQQPERERHLGAVEVAARAHRVGKPAHAALVDEHLDVARGLEIGERREQRPVRHGHVGARVAAVEPRHVHREQRAADAVADGVHLVRAAQFARRAHRRVHALGDVVVEAGVAHVRAGILPAGDVDVEALREQVAHQALFRLEVEHVELVDPRRHDHDRRRPYPGGGRGVVDQLQQAVAQDHRAGRGRERGADMEIARLGHAHGARVHVVREDLEAAPQAVAARLHRLALRHRVGGEEIRRRHRVQPVAPPERGAAAFLGREPGRLEERVLHVPRVEQVPLLQQAPAGLARPDRVAEAQVVGLRQHHVGAVAARQLFQGMQLQRREVAGVAQRQFGQLLRVHQPGGVGVRDGRNDAERIDESLQRAAHFLDAFRGKEKPVADAVAFLGGLGQGFGAVHRGR